MKSITILVITTLVTGCTIELKVDPNDYLPPNQGTVLMTDISNTSDTLNSSNIEISVDGSYEPTPIYDGPGCSIDVYVQNKYGEPLPKIPVQLGIGAIPQGFTLTDKNGYAAINSDTIGTIVDCEFPNYIIIAGKKQNESTIKEVEIDQKTSKYKSLTIILK